jgi:hypothetical protein
MSMTTRDVTLKYTLATKGLFQNRVVLTTGFQVFYALLEDAHRQGLTRKAMSRVPRFTYSSGIPVALRWSNIPFYGFTRAPFKLYRRRRSENDFSNYGTPIMTSPRVINSAAPVEWDGKVMFDVAFRVTMAGGIVRVSARDHKKRFIPDLYVTRTSSGWGRLRGAGICSLYVQGACTVEVIWGISSQAMLSMNWGAPVQVVGMPFRTGEVPDAIYRTAILQGYAPVSLTGLDAAGQRLQIAADLQLPAPAPVAGGPVWTAPDPLGFLQGFIDGRPNSNKDSFFAAVKACLLNTNDADSTHQQRHYKLHPDLRGAHNLALTKVAFEGETSMDVPVVGISMMSVSIDSFVATALGYGTIDLPPSTTIEPYSGGSAPPPVPANAVQPVGMAANFPYDYMLEQSLVYTVFQLQGNPVTVTMTVVAFGLQRPGPKNAANLGAQLIGHSMPDEVDGLVVERRKVYWNAPSYPIGYGVAVTRPGATTSYLNQVALGDKGYQPYVPTKSLTFSKVEDDPSWGQSLAIYVDKRGEQPYAGSVQTSYHVIAQDIFGRFSAWSQCSFTSTAIATQKPGLEKIGFEVTSMSANHQTGINQAAADLTIDFSWDWADRRPHKIRLYGRFYTPPKTLPDGVLPGDGPGSSPPPGFELGPSDAGLLIELTFQSTVPGGPPDPSLMPEPDNNHAGAEIGFLSHIQDDVADIYRYRLTLHDVDATFAADAKRRGYEVWARALEWVRPTNLYWSAAVGPVVNFFRDPNPPTVTDVPDVTWATLPDAANQSRITLTMDPSVPGAAGYVVWYATETQLLKALDEKGLLDWGLSAAQASALAHPAFANLDKRAEVLKDKINGSNAVDFAFTRITDKPVSDPKLEVTLPGDTTILHIYRFSTIGRNGLPSPSKSDITAVGVPRLAKPGVPGLIARPVYEPTPGIKLVAMPGPGEPSEGFRVFRTRREANTSYLGLMGPAIVNESQAWSTEPTAFHGQTQELPVYVDSQPISWFPYYYRIQAVGAVHSINGYQARDWGRYKGVSEPSVMVAVSLTPRQPPTLFNDADPQGLLQPILVNEDIQQQVNGAHVWNAYSFESDLPIERSPLGVAKITILEMWKDSQNGGKYKTDVLFEAETHDCSKIPILSALPTPAMMNNEILFGAAHHYRALLRFYRSPSNAFPRQYYLYLETFDPMEEVLVPPQGWEPDPANPTPPPLVPVQVPVLDRRLRILRLTDPLGRTTDKALKTVIP